MGRVVETLLRQPFRMARTSDYDLSRPDTEVRRLVDDGTILAVTKGVHVLVPEDRRAPGTGWRPTIEGAALGMAAALYEPDSVALVGPSAVRAHGCYPRPLGTGYVAVPTQRRARETSVGLVRFVTRRIDGLDTVRVDTDLGPGWATSVEQTALDLCRDRPSWDLTDEARTEILTRLGARIDWDLIDGIARRTRGAKTLVRLRREVGQVS